MTLYLGKHKLIGIVYFQDLFMRGWSVKLMKSQYCRTCVKGTGKKE